MAEEALATEEEQKPKAKLPLKMILIVGGVLLLEGVMVSMFWVMKGGPEPAEATSPIENTQEIPSKGFAEVVLAESFQVDNYMQGRKRTMVTLEAYARVEKAKFEELKELAENHSKELRDKIRTLISSAQPNDLKDPNLEVIKRMVKDAAEKIVGEGIINEILFPKWSSVTPD